MTNTNLNPPLSAMTVVALLTALTLELVRSTGALLEFAFDIGTMTAAGTALSTYLGAAVLGLGLVWVLRRTDPPTVVLVGVLLLTVARLVAQGLTATSRAAVGLTTTSLSIAVFTIAAAVLAGRTGGGRAVAVAVAAGAVLSMGIQLALGTWDAFWQDDWLGWGITILTLTCLVGAAELARRDPATTPTLHIGRMWVLGPALCLLAMVMANSAFAASHANVRLAIAGPVAALGLLLAGAVVSMGSRSTLGMGALPLRLEHLAIAVAPAIAIAGVFWTTGPLVLLLIVAAQLSALAVIAATLDRDPSGGPAPPTLARDAATAALVGLATILPLLLFHLDHRIPLGFPNELVIVATALLFGAATVTRGNGRPDVTHMVDDSATRGGPDRPSRALLVGAGVIALAGSMLAIGRDVRTDPSFDLGADRTSLTLMSWNLHYGVDPYGGIDLEQIARSIEEQNPSIITLQEVSRGWVLAGGTDMATWLAQRLDMSVAYTPAADRQFGNAVLTNLPTTNITAIDLPYGKGPQERSAISVDIPLPAGPIRVTSVHLQSREADRTPTRLAQIETLLAAQTETPPLIIAGDFNSRPGSAEIDKMTSAGLVSAQDVSGDPSAFTDPSINPVKRIDWVFGRGISFTSTEVLADALSSDHLPLVVIFNPE